MKGLDIEKASRGSRSSPSTAPGECYNGRTGEHGEGMDCDGDGDSEGATRGFVSIQK